ncbi:ribosomal protein L7/L12 [Butyrivibrio sp. AD3002]|uniref:ribosomal protein L7/L12 n=1 Tax=Butyrivibrio sp. AD3002 TaxID=1280670 RepID=UPI0003B76EE6|nr:ribosomal protein L7/L12 [Butyrivibrio sp. AD3002]
MASIRIKEIGPNKSHVIRVVRELSGLDLSGAKDLVDNKDTDGIITFELLPGITIIQATDMLHESGALLDDDNSFYAKYLSDNVSPKVTSDVAAEIIRLAKGQ